MDRTKLSFWAVVALITGVSASAATFSVSPASLSYDSPNPITLAVGALTTGQTVLIEEFADENGNSAIDAGETLLMSFRVADGEASTFPPSATRLGPGDDDALANGGITKILRLPLLAERLRGTGSYLFRVSALDASFSPIIRPFTVEAGSHAQAVTGTVLNSGVPVPFAMVALLGDEDDDSDFVAGALSDAAGRFTLRAQSGMYNLIALKGGYVFDFSSAALIDLTPGLNVTQDVAVVTATRTISGSVIDAATSNGIGGVQLFAESQNGQVALVFTDANGHFTVPVTADAFRIDASDLSLGLPGYGGRAERLVDATAGNVSGVLFPLSRGLGDFQLVFFFPSGGFANGTNGTIGFPTRLNYYYALYNLDDSNFPTNVLFTGPSGAGLNNTPSANFGANFEGDSAFYSSPQVNVPAYPPGGSYVVNYKGFPQTFALQDPDAANRQVILVPTAFLDGAGQLYEMRWTFRSVNGDVIAPPSFMASIELRIDGIGGRLYDSDILPGSTSHALNNPVTWSDVSSVQMVYDDDRGNQYVSFWNRASQPLQILTQSLPQGRVGSAYQNLFVAAGGFPPYSWSFVSGDLPAGISFTPVTGELGGMPQTSGTFTFRVRVEDNAEASLERTYDFVVTAAAIAPRLELQSVAPGQFGLRLIGEAGRSYTLQYSTSLASWTSLVTTNLTAGSADLVDSTATNQFRFYRVLLNQ